VVSLADVIGVLRRRWATFLLAMRLALGAGSLYLVVAKPSYSATAQVLIDTKRSDSPGAQFAVVDTAVVESQIETIKTDKIAVAVIKKLALDEDPEFIKPGRFTRLLSMVGLVQLERSSTAQGRLRTACCCAGILYECMRFLIGHSYVNAAEEFLSFGCVRTERRFVSADINRIINVALCFGHGILLDPRVYCAHGRGGHSPLALRWRFAQMAPLLGCRGKSAPRHACSAKRPLQRARRHDGLSLGVQARSLNLVRLMPCMNDCQREK
jgi:hypothetical protein